MYLKTDEVGFGVHRCSQLAAERGCMPATRSVKEQDPTSILRQDWLDRRRQDKIGYIVDYLCWLDNGAMPEDDNRNQRLAEAALAYLMQHLEPKHDWTEIAYDFLFGYPDEQLLDSFRADNAKAMDQVERAERSISYLRRCPDILANNRMRTLSDTGVDDIEEIRRQHMLRVVADFDDAKMLIREQKPTGFVDYLWSGNCVPWWVTVWRKLDEAGLDEAATVARQDPLVRLLYFRD